MGVLVDGKWQDKWYDTKSTGGAFKREESSFRNWVTADGSAGPTGEGGFKAESGRYHLYVSFACPWAHRTLIFRKLKQLEDHIDISVVHPDMLEKGWTFSTDFPGATGDRQFGLDYLHEVYIKAVPDVNGRATVPVLWDKQTGQIVSNESSEIIRMFNTAFNEVTGNTDDYWPEDLREAIEPVNDRIYNTVNNGVYKAGFATTQAAYDEAVAGVFEMLDALEDQLTGDFLFGDRLTESDIRAFVTLIRFDAAYHGLFKTNLRQIADYPRLSAFQQRILDLPGVRETVNMDHITRGYYSIKALNPTGIRPVGPAHVTRALAR